MKYQKIPTNNLGVVAYYLIQITQGIFRWNGELFFCPFVKIEDKKYPFRVSTWTTEGIKGKVKKYSLPFINNDMLCLFADPVHPSTYIRTRQRSMDRSLSIDSNTVVLKKGLKLIIKQSSTVHTLEFVKKITDSERKRLFDPSDDKEAEIRTNIHKASKADGFPYFNNLSGDEWLKFYDEYQLDKRIPSRLSGRVRQFLTNTGDW